MSISGKVLLLCPFFLLFAGSCCFFPTIVTGLIQHLRLLASRHCSCLFSWPHNDWWQFSQDDHLLPGAGKKFFRKMSYHIRKIFLGLNNLRRLDIWFPVFLCSRK
jgi:hypothetical protein